MKNRLPAALAALCLMLGGAGAGAALDAGEKAPDFVLPAALAGKVYQFSLAESLAKGPVVLYFFPAAFSSGCSAEAHEFAESIGQFEALGASVIGVSGDDIATQAKFSTQSCAGKFPVAADPGKTVIRSYDASMMILSDYANRVSYVIAPEGKIIYSYQSLSPARHVGNTLAALRDWQGKRLRSAPPDGGTGAAPR